MMKQPVTAGPEEEIGTVLNRMIDRHLDEIAVVDRENHLLADITVVDIIKFLTSSEQ
jgi:CBS domain-containing protein